MCFCCLLCVFFFQNLRKFFSIENCQDTLFPVHWCRQQKALTLLNLFKLVLRPNVQPSPPRMWFSVALLRHLLTGDMFILSYLLDNHKTPMALVGIEPRFGSSGLKCAASQKRINKI